MEEKKNKYHNGKIYCIRSHQTDMIYIGSTCGMLAKRLYGHKQNYKRWKNGKRNNVTSYEIVKYPDCYIELIEEYKCENKMELDRKEGEIIRATDNCVNKRVAGRTKREYYEDNKEQIAEHRKHYYENNKEEILHHQKGHYQDNREEIIQKSKKYYQDNREKIIQDRKKKYTCECGGKYVQNNKARHERSKKHKEFITIERSCLSSAS